MEEKTYLQDANVSVTSSRIAIGKQTFATRNVGSVRMEKTASPKWPYVVLVFGLLMMVGPSQRELGGIIAMVAAFAVWANRGKHQLVLVAGGGEVRAFESRREADVQMLHDAIVEAIATR